MARELAWFVTSKLRAWISSLWAECWAENVGREGGLVSRVRHW